jgi:hypothetical protein
MNSSNVILKRVLSVLAVAGALLFSLWLMTHTFSYDAPSGSMLLGQKVWSDFGQHIPVIRSFSHGANLDRLWGTGALDFPLYPGAGMRYHFLFYALVGFLESAGLRIDWALNIPSILGFAALLIAIAALARYLFKSMWVAILSVVFLLFNGSLAFVRFFTLHPLSLDTFRDIRTVTEFPAFAPWGPGLVSAFWSLNIYTNQRHLALAFALVLLFVLTTLRAEAKPARSQILLGGMWGVIFGLFPFFHQPSLLIVAVIMMCYFLMFPRLRRMLILTGSITAAIALPQLVPIMRNGVSGIAWYPGYLIHHELTFINFLTYWWQNLGLHSILIPVGFFLAPRRVQKALFPLVVIFIAANLVKVSIEPAASHKFFNFMMILGNMISAFVIVHIIELIGRTRLHHFAKYGGQVVVLAGLVGLLTLSGVIDFFVIANDSPRPLADIRANPAASWIDENTPRDAMFLNSNYLYHPASLAGRSIFLGWPYFPWSAGYPDDRMPILFRMYESRDPNVYCPLFREYDVSYVTVEDTRGDGDLPYIDTTYFFGNFTPEFEENGVGIFSVRTLCGR